jgi:uncharacterized protein YlbG (UPF0298 family)
MIGNRQGLIVWVQSLKSVKQLRRFGNVHYVSKKLKYAVIYCDMDQISKVKEKIDSFHFVKKTEYSYKPFIQTEFENSRPDKAKEYDYKIGL